MNTILIPYDFSESAETALSYAIGLTPYFSQDLCLLTVNSYPVSAPEIGLSSFTYSDAREDCLKELEKLASELKLKHPGIQVSYRSEMGELTSVINSLSKENNYGIIVMGISGHGNDLAKNLSGSSAVSVSKHCSQPVIIVPPGFQFKKPDRVAFACRFHDESAHPETLEQVKMFCDKLKADLHLVHIIKEGEPVNHTEAIVDNYLEHPLSESIHRTFLITDKKVSEGLMAMLNNNLLDMIVIQPKKHSFF